MEMNKGAPGSWCVLPWSHVSITEIGYYRLCCLSSSNKNNGILKDKKGNPLHVEKANWNSVFNNDRMKSIRKNMLKGKWSEECTRCKKQYINGMPSRNIHSRWLLGTIVEPRNYPGYRKAKDLTRPDGSISLKDFPPSYMDIRFGTKCNLKCVMCNPQTSSKWYDDWSALSKKNYFYSYNKKINLRFNAKKKLKPESNTYEWNDKFLSSSNLLHTQIDKNMQQLRCIYIAGGEPLLIKSHYDFLQKLIDRKVSKKILVIYSSNITSVPSLALKLWSHFKHVHIGMSLDGFGNVNDFIRYPSQWNSVKNNLLKLDQLEEENFSLSIEPAISVLNIWHLPEFIEFVLKQNYKKIGSPILGIITPHPVYVPRYLNINILEASFKDQIKKHFEFYKKKIRLFDWNAFYGISKTWNQHKKVANACQILDDYIRCMHHSKYNEEVLIKTRSQFIYFMDKLDKLRETRWHEIFPELYKSTMSWRKFPKHKI